MTEKLTLKKLSGELDELRARVMLLEQQLDQRTEALLGVIGASKAAGGERTGSREAPPVIDVEQHRQLIAEAAYLIAERRGFAQGDPLQDWIEAERQVNERLMQQELSAETRTEQPQKAAKAAAGSKRTARKKPASKVSRTSR